MAIPNAFRVLGVLGGVLALVAMHVVTGTTVRFLVRATEASGAGTYAACAARFCGDAARTAVQLAIVLNNFGIMVVYQIIFGDVLAGTPADLRTLPVLPDGPGSDAEDYADYDDNATRVYPPPLPPAAPPSDEDDEDAAPAALLPWAFARAGGSCRIPVAAVAPTVRGYPGLLRARTFALWPSLTMTRSDGASRPTRSSPARWTGGRLEKETEETRGAPTAIRRGWHTRRRGTAPDRRR